jgi:Xaa-Pro aminopeptidase
MTTVPQYSMRKSTRTKARLIYSASETDADMLWATRFFAPDPYLFIAKNGKRYVVMNDLEIDRAKSQATADHVLSYTEYQRRWQRRGIEFPLTAQVVAEVCSDLEIKVVEVPATFPVQLADQLRSMNLRIEPRPDPFWPEREFKTPQEVRYISQSLRAAEIGMEAGIDAVRRSQIRKDGYLYLDGTPLTSEILKNIINTTIMAQGYVPNHTIAASGNQCVDPHNCGSGRIRAHASIIMDIFPRSQNTGYYGDITRTVVRGRASERLKHAYNCVTRGQEIGFRRIRDGAGAYDIHHEILDYFRREGFPTGSLNGRMQGFFHGTGHGLGLEIHEPPSFGQRSMNLLRAGNVVTVEPGLYYQGMGGVRLEDVVIVTRTGCRNLVQLPKFLEV